MSDGFFDGGLKNLQSGAGRRQRWRESLAVKDNAALRFRIGKRHPTAIGEGRARNHDQAGGTGTGMCGMVTMRAAADRARFMSLILCMRLKSIVPISSMMRMGIAVFHRRL